MLISILQLKNKKKSSADVKSSIVLLLQDLKLFEDRNSLPSDLSGDQKRRLCLGMALIGGANVIFCKF